MKTIDELFADVAAAQKVLNQMSQARDDWARGKRPDLDNESSWSQLMNAQSRHSKALKLLQEAQHEDHLRRLPREGELSQMQAMLQRAEVLYKIEDKKTHILLQIDDGNAAVQFYFKTDGQLLRVDLCT